MRNKPSIGLHSLFKEYVDDCQFSRRLRPETIRGYRATFNRFCVLMPEITDAKSLSMGVMADFFRRLDTCTRIVGRNTKRTGVKPSSTRTYHSKLNSFFEWLHTKEIIDNNPLEHMKPPDVEYNDHRALEKKDVQQILAAVTLHSQNALILKRDMAMLHVLLFCGLRKTELISLHVTDIDMGKRILQVRGETSKSKKTRLIPMNPALVLHMQEYFAERNKKRYKTEFLWVSNNGDTRLSVHGLKHWTKRLNAASGVKFHLHQFRHTFACRLAELNAGAIKIQKLLGHTDLRMTQRYVRSMTVDDLRDEVDMLRVEGLV